MTIKQDWNYIYKTQEFWIPGKSLLLKTDN